MAQSVDRIARVNEILKREIADIIEKLGLNEDKYLISVTKVHTSSCLRNAAVYVSIYGAKDDKCEDILRQLAKQRAEIQRRVAKHVVLKYTPVLHFINDRNMSEADKVLSLMKEIEGDQ